MLWVALLISVLAFIYALGKFRRGFSLRSDGSGIRQTYPSKEDEQMRQWLESDDDDYPDEIA